MTVLSCIWADILDFCCGPARYTVMLFSLLMHFGCQAKQCDYQIGHKFGMLTRWPIGNHKRCPAPSFGTQEFAFDVCMKQDQIFLNTVPVKGRIWCNPSQEIRQSLVPCSFCTYTHLWDWIKVQHSSITMLAANWDKDLQLQWDKDETAYQYGGISISFRLVIAVELLLGVESLLAKLLIGLMRMSWSIGSVLLEYPDDPGSTCTIQSGVVGLFQMRARILTMAAAQTLASLPVTTEPPIFELLGDLNDLDVIAQVPPAENAALYEEDDFLNPFDAEDVSWEGAARDVGLEYLEPGTTLRIQRPISLVSPRPAQAAFFAIGDLQPIQIIRQIEEKWVDVGSYPSFINTWRLQKIHQSFGSSGAPRATHEYVLRAETDQTLGEDILSAVIIEMKVGADEFNLEWFFATTVQKVIDGNHLLEMQMDNHLIETLGIPDLQLNGEPWPRPQNRRLWHGDLIRVMFVQRSALSHTGLHRRLRSRSPRRTRSVSHVECATNTRPDGPGSVLSPPQGTYPRARIEISAKRDSTIHELRVQILRQWPRLGQPAQWAPIHVHDSFRCSPFLSHYEILLVACEHHVVPPALRHSMIVVEVLRMSHIRLEQSALKAIVCLQYTDTTDLVLQAGFAAECLTHSNYYCEFWQNGARVTSMEELHLRHGDFFAILIRQRFLVADASVVMMSLQRNLRLHHEDTIDVFPPNLEPHRQFIRPPENSPSEEPGESSVTVLRKSSLLNWHFLLMLSMLMTRRRMTWILLFPTSIGMHTGDTELWLPRRMNNLDDYRRVGNIEIVYDLRSPSLSTSERPESVPHQIILSDLVPPPIVAPNSCVQINGQDVQTNDRSFVIDSEEDDLVAFTHTWCSADLFTTLPCPTFDLHETVCTSLIETPFVTDELLHRLAHVTLYVDGSFFKQEDCSGWSFVAIGRTDQDDSFVLGWLCEKITTDREAPGWSGAEKNGSHEAELTALLFAGWWALHLDSDIGITFIFDNIAAGMISAGRWNPQTKGSLPEAVRGLHQWLENKSRRPQIRVSYEHTKAHVGNPWNELADGLAKWAAKSGQTLFKNEAAILADYILGPCPKLSRMVWFWKLFQEDPAYPPTSGDQVEWARLDESSFKKPNFVDQQRPGTTESTNELFALRVVTYNVATLSEKEDVWASKPEFLRAQLEQRQVAIAALQETRAKQQLLLETPNYYRVISSACKGQGGTELWFSKSYKYPDGSTWHRDDFTVTFFDPELLCMTIKTPYGLLGIVNGHAPHSARDDDDRLTWWQNFERQSKRLQNCFLVMWCGDFNAQFEPSDGMQIGELTDVNCNHNGQLCIKVAAHQDMWIPSTFLACHFGPNPTWFSAKCPEGKRLDYFALTNKLQYKSVSTWVDQELDAGQLHDDHLAMCMDFDLWPKTKGTLKSQRKSIDRAAFRVQENRDKIQSILADVQQPLWSCDPHSHYDDMAKKVFETLADQFPAKKIRPRKSYISEQSWFTRQQKQQARAEMHSATAEIRILRLQTAFSCWKSREYHPAEDVWKECSFRLALAISNVAKLQRLLKRSLVDDRRNHFDNLAKDAAGADVLHIWEKLRKLGIGRNLRKMTNKVLPMLHRPDGKPAESFAEAQELWRQHASTLEFGKDTTRSELWLECVKRQLDAQEDLVPPEAHLLPTLIQLERACRKVKPNKATGPDGLIGELYHFFPDQMAKLLHPLALKVFVHRVEPLSLKDGRLIRAWKGRGATTAVEHYRGLMIANHAGKILHSIFRSHLIPSFEVQSLDLQLGGKRRALVTHGAHAVRSFVSWCQRSGRPSAVVFLDIRTAFYRLVRPLVSRYQHFHQQIVAIIERFQLPPTALQELYSILGEKSAMEEAEVAPFLESLMTEFNESTWFEVDGIDQLTHTEAGSRPGDPLADITFSFLFSKVMQKVQKDLEEIGVLFALNWCGQRTLFPEDHTNTITTSLFEVIWADDLAIMITAPEAKQLVRRVAVASQVIVDHCLDHGLEPNMDRGKTEVILALRGKGSVAARKQVFSRSDPTLHFESRHWGQTEIRIVTQYTHLGGKIGHQGNDKTEMIARMAYAKTMFNSYRKHLFQSRMISLDTKTQLLVPLVLSTMQYAMGTWSNYSEKTLKTVSSRLINLYQRTLICEYDHEHLVTMSHEEILAKVQLPSYQEFLHICRLRHLGSLLRVGPLSLWALLEHEGEWLNKAKESMRWMWQQLCYSVELGDPMKQWNEWQQLMQNQPKRWAGLIIRAQKHAVLQRVLLWSRVHWNTVILETLTEIGLEPDWQKPVASHKVDEHLCGPCKMRFRTASAWSVHAFKVHSRVHFLRYYLDHTTCKSCATEYWSQARLHRHLRYSNRCSEFYLKWVPKVPIQPGLNSRHHNQFEPPILSPPVDTATVFEVEQRYFGVDPETESHPELVEALADALEVDIEQLADYSPHHTMWSLVEIIKNCLLRFSMPFKQLQLTWKGFADNWNELLSEERTVEHLQIWAHTIQVVSWRFCADWLVPTKTLEQPLNQSRVAPSTWLDTDPELRWKNPNCERIPKLLSERFVVHFFAGRRRVGDLQQALEHLPPCSGFVLHVLSLDLIYGEQADLLQRQTRRRWLNIFSSGVVLSFWSGPPCESWSSARHHKLANVKVRPVRSALFPWGLPSLALREATQVLVANLLMLLVLLCLVLQMNWGHMGMIEHPSPPRQVDRASIWRTRIWRVIREAGARELLVLQGLFGARSAKPTHLGFVPKLGWYESVLRQHQTTSIVPSEVSIGRNASGNFYTTALKEYPEALNKALAAIFHKWVSELPDASPSMEPLSDEIRELFKLFEVYDDVSMGADYQPPTARIIHAD